MLGANPSSATFFQQHHRFVATAMRQRQVYIVVAVAWIVFFSAFLYYTHGYLLQLFAHTAPRASVNAEHAAPNQHVRLPVARPTAPPTPLPTTPTLPPTPPRSAAAAPRDDTLSTGDWSWTHDELAWRARIFVNMAAYRDQRCHMSIWQAITRATNPYRVTFGVYQQHNDSADPDCLHFASLCDSVGPDATTEFQPHNEYDATRPQLELVCSRLPAIRIRRIDFLQAEGPTVGRFMAQELMEDEDFYLQIDTHSYFVGGWDVEQVIVWQLAADRNAVLTTYPRSANEMPAWQRLLPSQRTDDAAPQYHVDQVPVVRNMSLYPYNPNRIFFPPIVPVVCSGKFLDAGMGFMPKFDAHRMLRNTFRPMPCPYFAAGYAFMPARAVRVCRYDRHTPMLFDGEEFSYAARLYTHGFNLYAPPVSIVYHFYETGTNPKYWQVDWSHRYLQQRRSARRINAVLSGTPPPVDAQPDYDTGELARFGLGPNRTLDEYLRYAGVNMQTRHFINVCGEISQGNYPPRGTGRRVHT